MKKNKNKNIKIVKNSNNFPQSNREYPKNILDNLFAFVGVMALDGTLIDANNAPVKAAGLKKSDVVGKKFWDCYWWSYSTKVQKELKKAYKKVLKGEVVRYDVQVRMKNDSRMWIDFQLSPYFDSGKKITYLVPSAMDISERKKAEDILAHSELRFRKLFEANIVGLVLWNIDGTIIDANDVFLDTVGYSRQDLKKGKINWRNMTPAEYEEIDKKAIKELNEMGHHFPIRKEFIKKDGIRVNVLSGSTFIDAQKKEGVGFVLNISKQVELERQKDAFLGIASHELKTPVTSIKAYTQVLQSMFHRKGEAKAVESLQKMDTQINKLTFLINDLLDVTKIQAGKLELHDDYFDINELIIEIVEQMQLTTQNQKLLKKLDKTKTICADRERIGQVLTNLISNAIKYSNKSEKIIIKTKNKNEKLTVCIQDFGEGIPKTELGKVFNQFYRLNGSKHNTRPGIGLGLHISSEIIKKQNGKIWVKSKEGKGSTFCFSLPIKN